MKGLSYSLPPFQGLRLTQAILIACSTFALASATDPYAKSEAVPPGRPSSSAANAERRESFTVTPLHVAAMLGRRAQLQALIDVGADPGATDEDGDLPLYWAALGDPVESVRLLLEEAEESGPGSSGKPTAMELAARIGGIKFLDILLRSGLDRSLSPFSFPDSEVDLFTYRDSDGKLGLFNLWATWRAPCWSEMPWLAEFQNRYRGRGFTVVAVSLDEDGRNSVRPLIEELRLNFPGLMGGDEAEATFGTINSIPFTLIIDR